MVQRIYTETDLANIFEKNGYGMKFSYDGYRALLDYYDGIDENFECDVIGISCEWSEMSDKDLWIEYDHLLSFADYLIDEGLLEELKNDSELLDMEEYSDYWDEYIDALVDKLEYHTTVLRLSDSYLVQAW